MLSNAYFLAKFRFDTAENEPAKNLQKFDYFLGKLSNFPNFPNSANPNPKPLKGAHRGAQEARVLGLDPGGERVQEQHRQQVGVPLLRGEVLRADDEAHPRVPGKLERARDRHREGDALQGADLGLLNYVTVQSFQHVRGLVERFDIGPYSDFSAR